MEVLVIGAGGKTGKLVVERAVARGHEVTALLHLKEDQKQKDRVKEEASFPSGVQIVHGDARNPSRLDQVMTGQKAVIDALGGSRPFLETDLETSSAKVIVDVMKRNEVKRLIVISAMGEGESRENTGFFYEHLLMPMFLSGTMRDKGNMEAEVQKSGLDFILVRPPLLKDSDATGQIHVVTGTETAHTITRGDLAQFLVDQLSSDEYVGQAVTIANR